MSHPSSTDTDGVLVLSEGFFQQWQLLHRTTRRIDLTTEAEAYLMSCRGIIDELDQAEAFLSTGHQLPIGRLRVDFPTTFSRRHILRTLLELGVRYEKLDLSVTLRDRTVDMVSEGIDLAVRIGILADYPDLVARRLGEQKLIVWAAPAYLKRRGVPLVHTDLHQHDCHRRMATCQSADVAVEKCCVRPRTILKIQQLISARLLIATWAEQSRFLNHNLLYSTCNTGKEILVQQVVVSN